MGILPVGHMLGEPIPRRRTRFLTAYAAADIPETTRPAGTIETWWAEIEVFLTTRATNARTRG